MKNLCIIADDLTGSTDTGVQFSKCGLRTFVVFDHKFLKDIETDYQIISINSETRNTTVKNAYERVKEITRIAQDSGFNIFYKKLDSTLRGNPGAEIEAMLDELGSDLAFIAPSFPDNGRIVENGYLYIKKEELNDKENQFHPIGYVPDFVKSEDNRALATINISDVRKGIANIRQKIDELRKADIQLFAFDAITNEDLQAIASAIKIYSDKSVFAGSAGLAEYISSQWGFMDTYTEANGKKPILFLAGTYNPVTAEQVRELIAQGSTELVTIQADKIINGDTRKEVDKAVEISRKSLTNSKDTVVAIDTLLKNNKESYKLQMDFVGAEKIARSFGTIAKQLVSQKLVDSLIVTGGETAAYIFESMGARGMILGHEILPGIPNGKLIGGRFEGLQVVTKAGGFGEKDSFIRITKFLNRKAGV